jgi:uncharacterized protein (DUF1697 family)
MKKTTAKNSSVPFVAFLRGINVGGNNLIKMADLKRAFESLGFENVKTLGASGNVAFGAPARQPNPASLGRKIEEGLRKAFAKEISVILRTVEHLKELDRTKPFAGVKITTDIRLYVTFLSEKPRNSLRVPYVSPGKDFRILAVSDTEIFSVTDLSKGATVESMRIIEKEFGRNVTTRNWNTIVKLVEV